MAEIRALSPPPRKRRAVARDARRAGRYVRATPVEPGDRHCEIAIDATLRAVAARASSLVTASGGARRVTRDDLRKKERTQRRRGLVVFVVDASDSMETTDARGGAVARMGAAKGAVVALLRRAYQSRDRVALVAFREREASVLLPPTRSVKVARERLARLPSGGTTPLSQGLATGWRLIRMERLKDPGLTPLLVVISDGEANVAMDPGRHAGEEACEVAHAIAREGIPALAIDTKRLTERGPEMRQLAAALGASYRHISGIGARGIVEALSELYGAPYSSL